MEQPRGDEPPGEVTPTSPHHKRDKAKVHSSAHPDLPPAQCSQVIQFLLARNYHLTALELLVESQQSGHHEEVVELQHFFKEPTRYPPEEVAKHQNANALDIQAQQRERESKLQLAEYELRLAKEDLAEMTKRMDAQQQAMQRLSSSQTSSPVAQPSSGGLNSARERSAGGTSATSPPLSPRRLESSAAAAAHAVSAGGAAGGGPSAHDIKALNSSVVSYLLQQGYKVSAMSLMEEVGGHVSNCSSQEGVPDQLYSWYLAAKGRPVPSAFAAAQDHADDAAAGQQQQADQGASSPLSSTSLASPSHPGPGLDLEQELTRLRQELALAQQQLQLQQLQQAGSGALHGPGTGPGQGSGAVPGSAGGSPVRAPGSYVFGRASTLSPRRSSLELPVFTSGESKPPAIDPLLHESLCNIMSLLAALLPRLVPNTTLKTRQELLPMMQAVILTHSDPEVQRELVGVVMNLVPNPDPQQRAAIVATLQQVAMAFGPAWTAQEVVGMCCKQVTAPSAERRCLVAQVLACCVGLVDLGSQAHVLLTQLHRLAEDRLEEVREAAVSSLATLLARLPFSKSYYAPVEDLVMGLAKDTADRVHGAVMEQLMPALLAWSAPEPESITTSLLPKVITDLGQNVRSAVAQHAPVVAAPAAPGSPLFAGSVLSYSAAGPPKRFPNQDYQLVYQLLGVYMALLPPLRAAALRACPSWAIEQLQTMQLLQGQGQGLLLQQEGQQWPGGVLQPGLGLEPVGPDDLRQLQPPAGATAEPASEGVAVAGGREGEVVSRRSTPVEGSAAEGGSGGAASEPAGSGSGLGLGAGAGLAPSHSSRVSLASLTPAGPVGYDGAGSGRTTPSHSRSTSIGGPPLVLVNASEGQEDPEALFAVWALSDRHMQWKSMQWVVQLLIPELLDAVKSISLQPDTAEVRRQFSKAFSATCHTFGPGFSRTVLLPLFTCAAGALQVRLPTPLGEVLGQAVPQHVQEAAMDLTPHTDDAVKLARERVLPQLVSSVLPAAQLLGPHLLRLMGTADTLHNRWLMDSLEEWSSAVAFACEFQPELCQEVLQVLEQLVGGSSGSSNGGAGTPTLPAAGLGLGPSNSGSSASLGGGAMASLGAAAAASGPASTWAPGVSSSTPVALCAVALANGVARVATAEQMSKRVMPALMVLLSRGDQMVQLAVVEALLDVLLRFREEGKLMEQVFVVYDGLLQQGTHDTQVAVVACGARLASAVAGSAFRSATAAQQLEWLLQSTQFLAQQLQGSPKVAPGPPRSPEQQRTLAAQLAAICTTIHSFDVRLPRLQSSLQTAAEVLLQAKAMLADSQAASLAAMLKEQSRPGAGAGGSSISALARPGGAGPHMAPGQPLQQLQQQATGEASSLKARFASLRSKLTRRKDESEMDPDPSAPSAAAAVGPGAAAGAAGLGRGLMGAQPSGMGRGVGGGNGGQGAQLGPSQPASSYKFFSDDEDDA